MSKNDKLRRARQSGLLDEKSMHSYEQKLEKKLAEKQEKWLEGLNNENQELKFKIGILKMSLDSGLLIDPIDL